jgi:hypothetical protein
MKNAYRAFAGMAFVALPLVTLMGPSQPTQAQAACIALKEITTGQTVVRKQISTGALGNNNWNTDFAVPVGVAFSSYTVRIVPENNANYQITINLKYNNRSSSTVFKRTVPLLRFNPFVQNFRSPTARQPFQINTNIGGDRNNAYSVSAFACR